MRVIDSTASLSVEVLSSSSYPVPVKYAAGVSMGDGSALVCGGTKLDNSRAAECNYVDVGTVAVAIAQSLPEPVAFHKVVKIGLTSRA